MQIMLDLTDEEVRIFEDLLESDNWAEPDESIAVRDKVIAAITDAKKRERQ